VTCVSGFKTREVDESQRSTNPKASSHASLAEEGTSSRTAGSVKNTTTNEGRDCGRASLAAGS
jgi:hypothetical protein